MALQYKFQPQWSNNYVGVHHYKVTVDDGTTYVVADEGILKVGGFTMSYDAIKFRMSLDRTERRLPGKLSASDVTIERVVRGHDGLWKWYKAVVDGNIMRYDVKVELFGQGGSVVSTLTLYQAFPLKWEFPALDATSSAHAIEKITLAVEDILYVSTAAAATSTPPPSEQR